MTEFYVLARKFGSTRVHVVDAAGPPAVGRLIDFRTFCGLVIDDVGPWGWTELDRSAPRDAARDCKRCARVQIRLLSEKDRQP